MLTIITPSCRQKYLVELSNSIQFEKIDRWIIVYDTSKNRVYDKLFNNPQIVEVFCDAAGSAGHAQRNFGVKMVSDGHIYFLDDDNIMHPEFWNLQFQPGLFYTFDQMRSKAGDTLRGNRVRLGAIDTAMFVVPKRMFVDWHIHRYDADGLFISRIYCMHRPMHRYVKKTACYYNWLV